MDSHKGAPFSMLEVLPLLPLPQPPGGRSSYNMDCPLCGDNKKHLNINLEKNVFKCPRCGVGGGVLALYSAFRNCSLQDAYGYIKSELRIDSVQGMATRPSLTVKSRPQCKLADIETRHAAYAHLLSMLPLEKRHREALERRGLPNEVIEKAMYRSYPRAFHTDLAHHLQCAGCGPEGIPGFYIANRKWRLTENMPGFLIPVLDLKGRIQGLQVRLDDAAKRKYRWVSSSDMDYGCGADGSCAHIAGIPGRVVIITEGPLKADIISMITGLCVVGLIGVSAQKYLPDILGRMKGLGLEKAYLAFDMDFLSNKQVIRDYDKLKRTVSEAEIPYTRLLWKSEYKGLDDYLTAVPNGKDIILTHIRKSLTKENKGESQ